MTDAEKDVQQALALEGYSNNYFQPIWNEFASGWDGQPCSEIACCISYLAGNLSKIYVSNYAQGLVDLFRANGRFYGADTIPQKGDFIWFDYGYGEGASHTGRVVDVSNGTITTIEGNMWVGGEYNQVAKLYYPIGDYRIYGFGRPNYTYQQVDTYSIRNYSPENENLPYYNNSNANGINTAINGNSPDGQGVTGANVLNNCVGYSQGRMIEMLYELTPSTTGNPFSMFNANAEDWITVANNNGFNTGSTPDYGAIGVWTNGSIGHVANVETYQDNTWWISEGHWNYGGSYGSWDFSYLHSSPEYLPDFLATDTSWHLLGFIYPFSTTPTPPTPPQPPFIPPVYVKRMPLWMKIRYLRTT